MSRRGWAVVLLASLGCGGGAPETPRLPDPASDAGPGVGPVDPASTGIDAPDDAAFESDSAQVVDHVIHPAKAGRWYPAVPAACLAAVDGYLEQAGAPPSLPGRPVALVVPHAGWRFSGAIAGAGFAAVRDQPFETVVIVGVCHRNARIGFTGLSVLAEGAMESPLGRTAIDSEMAREIVHAAGVAPFVPEAFVGEHSIELVLPFVQRCWPAARIVPVMVKSNGYEDDFKFATAIASAVEVLDTRTLIVASTDLAHGAGPADTRRVDDATLATWTTLRPRIIRWASVMWTRRGIAGLSQAMCGRDPLFATLWAARQLGGTHVTVVAKGTSADTPHHVPGSVVGYGAAVVTAHQPALEQQHELVELARTAALAALGHGAKPDDAAIARLGELSGLAPGGAFVGLKQGNRLHGCIGRMSGAIPLGRLIADVAASAAHDPRAPSTELDYDTARALRVEISLLSGLERIARPEDIVLGVHGVKVVRGSGEDAKGATFLPQVAPEQGWDHAKLFERLARKAGLETIDFADPATRVYRYTAFVFSG